METTAGTCSEASCVGCGGGVCVSREFLMPAHLTL